MNQICFCTDSCTVYIRRMSYLCVSLSRYFIAFSSSCYVYTQSASSFGRVKAGQQKVDSFPETSSQGLSIPAATSLQRSNLGQNCKCCMISVTCIILNTYPCIQTCISVASLCLCVCGVEIMVNCLLVPGIVWQYLPTAVGRI